MPIDFKVPEEAKAVARLAVSEIGLAARRAFASGIGSLMKDARRTVQQADRRLREIEDNARRIRDDEP